jgi:hypothetical protein
MTTTSVRYYSVSELRERIRAELSRKRRGEKTLTRHSEEDLVCILRADNFDNRDEFVWAGLGQLIADDNLPIAKPRNTRITDQKEK